MDNQTQTQTQNDLLRLRQRLLDLQRTQRLDTEAFGLYQQTVLQIQQEAERRKLTCFQQAETLRAQASSVEAQGHAFSSISSILYSVVNGYIEIEEKRLREDQERAKERAETQAAATTPPPSVESKKRRKNAGDQSD
jgi:hypothetical protein